MYGDGAEPMESSSGSDLALPQPVVSHPWPNDLGLIVCVRLRRFLFQHPSIDSLQQFLLSTDPRAVDDIQKHERRLDHRRSSP